MQKPSTSTWFENESNWKNGFTVNFQGERTELKEAEERYLMNLIRFYGAPIDGANGFDTTPVKRELIRRWTEEIVSK